MVRTASSAVIRSWRLRRVLLQTSALVGCALAVPQAWGQAQVPPPPTLPEQVNIGAVQGVQQGNTMTFDLKGQDQTLTFKTFNVGAGNTVDFQAGGVDPTKLISVLNRVNAGGGTSLIDGSITSDANVRVWLVNPEGITFGASGAFRGGGLVLSTLDVPDLGTSGSSARSTQFSGASTAGIVLTGGDNSGSITATSGSIVLVAQQIDAGKGMTASNGSVALVAASDVTFPSGIDSPLLFTVGEGTTLGTAQVNVSGAISGQAIRIEGQVKQKVTAALLNVAPNASLTATASGDGVLLKANADVVVAGNVRSAGNYAVDGNSVVLGETGAVHQQSARGGIGVTATSGALETMGDLQLQASGVGSTGTAVTLTASSGDVILGGGTFIQTGAFIPGETNLPTGLAGVSVEAANAATVAGGVRADGAYAVSGERVTLGTASVPTEQRASGAVSIAGTNGIQGLGALHLQADSEGSGNAALTLDTSQALTFDAASVVESGIDGARSDVLLAFANASSLGTVHAGSLRSPGKTNLQLGGSLDLGKVTVSGRLDIDAGAHAIRADAIDAASGIELVGNDGEVQIGSMTTAAGDIAITTNGTVSMLGAVDVAGAYGIRAKDVVLGTAGATVQQVAGGGVSIQATGGISGLGTLTLQARGLSPADTLALSANGAIDFAATTSLVGGAGGNSLDLVLSAASLALGTVEGRRLLGSAGGSRLSVSGDVTLGTVTMTDGLDVSSGGLLRGGTLKSGGSIALESRGAGVVVGSAEAAAGLSIDAGTSIRIGSGTATAGDVRLTASAGDISGLARSADATDGRMLVGYERATLTAGGDGATTSVVATRGTAQLDTIKAGRAGGGRAGGLVQVDAGAVDLLQALAVQGSVDLNAGAGRVVAGRLEGESVGVTASQEARLYDAVLARTGSYAVTAETITLGGGGSIVQSAAGDVTLHARGALLGADDTVLAGLGALTLQSNTNGVGGALRLEAERGAIAFDAASTVAAGIPNGLSLLSVSAPSSLTLGIVTGKGVDVSSGGPLRVGTLKSGGSVALESRLAGVVVGSAEAAAGLSIDAGTSIRIGSATATAGDVRLTASGGDISGLANAGNSTGGRVLAGYDRVDLTASGDGATISVKAASGTAYLGSITAGRADGILPGGLVEIDAGAVDLLQALAIQGSVSLNAGAGSVVAGRLEGDNVGVTASKNTNLYGAVLARTGSYAVTAETITLGDGGSVVQSAAGDVTLHATGATLDAKDTSLAGLGALTLQSNTKRVGTLRLEAERGAIDFNAASTVAAGDGLSLLSVSAPSNLTLGTVRARALRGVADPVQLVVGGDVTLGSVTVTDTLDVKTGGGSIVAGDLTSLAGAVVLTSAPGGITLGSVSGAMGVGLDAAGDLRLGEANAVAGDITLDAGGDLTGLAGTAVAGDTLPIAGYGRAVVRATGDGGLVTITAGRTAQLGTVTAGVSGGNSLGGTQIDLSASAIDVHDASALQGDLVLTRNVGTVVAGALTGESITIDASGGVWLPDVVRATRGDYSVFADTVTLGGAPGIAQQAVGAVTIRARALSLAPDTTQTTLRGLGSLTLASGGAMTLRADRGGIDLGAASVVTVGAAGSRAALSIGSGAALTLGTVTAGRLGGIDGATALVVPGKVVLGMVTLDQALNLATTAGSVTADAITLADAGESLAISAGGTGSIAITRGLGTNDGDILLSAAGNVTAPTLTVLPGTTAGAGSIVVLAGGSIDLGTVSADEDIRIRAGADAVLGDLGARDDIDLYSTGAMTLTTVRSTGDGDQGRDFLLVDPALAGTSAAIVVGPATTPNSADIRITGASIGGTALTGNTDAGLVLGQLRGSEATLTADLADVRIGTAAVQGSLGVTAGRSFSGLRTGWSGYVRGGPVIATTGAVTLDLVAPGGSIEIGTLTAGTAATTGSGIAGTLRIGQVTADTVTMAAQNGLQIDTTTATGAVSLHLLGTPAGDRDAGSAVFDGAVSTAGTSVSVTAGSTAFVDTVEAGNDIALTAGGALTVLSAVAHGLGTGDARITLAAATVTAGTLSNQGRGDILVSAAGDARVTDATAAQGTLALLAGGSITSTGTLTAAEDIAVAAAGNAQFGTLRAGDDIDLGIGGTVTLADAATSGLGSDTRAVTFDVAGAGLPSGIGFASETAALGGSTLRIRAAALGGPALTGSAADGLEVGGLQAGTATLRADSGDIRVRDLRSAGPAQATATLGSVTGLSDGWTALAGGARLASAGKLVFGVGGAIEAGSVTAATGVTTEVTAGSIRIASVTAGSLDLTAASALRIDSAAITGAASLRTTGGSAGPVNPPGGALVAGYGRGVFTAIADTATLQISGASAVQTGLLTSGTGLQVRGGAVDVGAVNVRFGTAQLSATTGRLALGTSGSGGSTGGGSSGPLAVPSGGASSSDLTIEADGDVNLGSIGSTTGRIFITSREGNVTGLGTISAASAGGAVQISAAGAIRVAGIQAGLQGGSATGDQISVTGQSIDLGAADARSGAISLRASHGGLTLGATTATGSATLVKRGAGTLALTGALTAGGDVLLDSQGDVEIGGAIGATGSGSRITVRNAGTGGTAIGDTRGNASFQLTQAEMGRLSAGTVIIDSGAQAVTIGDLAIAAGTGSGTLAFTTTGAVRLTGALTGATGGVVQIGGSSIDAPAAVADPAKLATTLSADVAGGARIALDKGVLDLRAQRIVFGNSALVGRYLPSGGSAAEPAAVARDVENSGSDLYRANASNSVFLSARSMRVSYTDFALFQNTGGANSTGVTLNDQAGLNSDALALQLFSTGDAVQNVFALFGRVNGFADRAAGLLPNSNVEISAGGLVRVTRASSRLNGCVIGAPERGCLQTDVAVPDFALRAQVQTGLVAQAQDNSLFFNPLVGRGNEGLIVDIVEAPVNLDRIDCPPGADSAGPCAVEASPK